ncbi:hypothetical protein AR9_g094 [Bacillus phage AR9]|uniref:Uncharacterized protein n=1 Tax=Bacillus phage AR9 TaxID=1815509 RepID=A0A172JI08_BPPB1|nr:hypothetical protein BI022_gp093 [Bacillus phage AR9]AMS01178.1 hypothetical protein AR9_g094 [Bacillus phage AR9]PTU25733.1 hypothetical protein DA469_22235 [Bacillus subtilis]
MEKQYFLEFVHNTIKENPDWLGEAVLYMQDGLKRSLEEERQKRNDAEYALVMAYDMLSEKKLNSRPANHIAIKKVLKNSSAFQGTAFVEELDV